MEQLKVEFPERKPTEEKANRNIVRVITATLDLLFFDGETWFPYTAEYSIPINKQVEDVADLKNTKASAEKCVWRWFLDTMKAGEVQVDGKPIKIYGVAAEPIYQEVP